MFPRDWLRELATGLIVVALVGAGIVGVLAIERIAHPTHSGGSGQAEQQDNSAEPFLQRCAALETPEQSEATQQCDHARSYADLGAQQDMARAAWAQFWLNVVGLFLLGATVFFAWKAWQESKRSADASIDAVTQAKRQADIAQRQLEESRIPELFVDVPVGGINLRKPGLPSVTLRIANIGSTLAVYTGGYATLLYLKGGYWLPSPASEDFFASRPYILHVGGRPLIPNGAPLEKEISCVQPGMDWTIPRAGADRLGTLPVKLSGPNFFISGWFEYRNQWGDEFAQTFGFFYSAPHSDDIDEMFIELTMSAKVKPGAYLKHIRGALQREGS